MKFGDLSAAAADCKPAGIVGSDNQPNLYEVPDDLYVHPAGLEVITQVFEGPLDLLLYLIRKNKFNVLDIPVAEIAEQYSNYIELMKQINIEVAGEYLAMAARLAQIKSRLLLPPKPEEDEEPEIDPRLELARRLQEYERISKAAMELETQPRVGREIFLIQVESHVEQARSVALPPIEMVDLVAAFRNVISLAIRDKSLVLGRETFSVKDRIAEIVDRFKRNKLLHFEELYDESEGRAGVVVAFLAMLELVNSNVAYAVQTNPDDPIHLHLNE